MREIKFRAWDKALSRYRQGLTLSCTTGQICSSNPDHYIVEQFTGLHDKNGKEIYEGDILKETAPRGNVYRVFGAAGGFVINAFQDEITNLRFAEPLANMQTSGYIQEQCVVIGNVHENPELLEANK